MNIRGTKMNEICHIIGKYAILLERLKKSNLICSQNTEPKKSLNFCKGNCALFV